MTTPVQTFDLYDLGGSTAADMYEGDAPAANPPITSEQLTAVINQILDDNTCEAIDAMDLTRDDHREYLAGTIAHAMLGCADVHITTTNTSEDK
tara:strand:+ start:417 stop:698 length:282 start_codon:yes stop_codon:yes gene_type:complete